MDHNLIRLKAVELAVMYISEQAREQVSEITAPLQRQAEPCVN
jgi:hypothetical protein